MTAKVTILVPNYKTLELTKLCLRLIRKYTPKGEANVIVIDNDSADESLDYLRSLSWIELIERKAIPGESPPLSHSRALDLGLAATKTPYVLSIHTDTLVKSPQWLSFLIKEIERCPNVAGVGSWKLEYKSLLQRLAKAFETKVQTLYYGLIGKKDHAIEGKGKNYYYLRSHCALYRMDLIQQLKTSFSDGEETAGKVMHKKLLDAGFEMTFLPSEILSQYIEHINHATMILNPELGIQKNRINKGMRRVKKALARFQAERVLEDVSLDQ